MTECSVVIFGVTFFREKSPGPYGPIFVLTDPGGAIFLATRQIAAKESPAAWPQYRENGWNRLMLLTPCDIMNKIVALDVR